MALLATHVKFALDIKGRYDLRNVGEYCAGAAYPDSRYVTGVNRARTHFEDSPKDPFMDGLTDFERGWAAHNLYDMTAGPMYKELLPWPAKDLEKFNYVWCYLTALKVIEDIVAYSMFGSELPQLQGVGCSIRPMNEDADKLARYYEGLRVLYADRPSMQAYGKMLLDWGAAEEVCEGVIEAAERIDSDERLKKDVLKIYGKVLDGL